jgi:branched-chain amino acid transport system permease protein
MGAGDRSRRQYWLLSIALLSGILITLLLLNRWVMGPAMDGYYRRILLIIGINITMAVSLNLINGFAGQFSLGHAGFMAVGAYAGAAFTLRGSPALKQAFPFLTASPMLADALLFALALLLAGALAAAAGWIVGLPSLRLRGDYLAIVTLGFGEIIRVVLLNFPTLGGPQGLFGIPAYTNFFWVALVAVAVVLLSRNIATSTHGLAFLSVREDEIAAEAMGVPTTRTKVLAFVIGAFFAGMGGALYAHQIQFIQPGDFSFIQSILFVTMVVLGGTGSITGSVLAAAVLTYLPERLRDFQHYRMIVYSLTLILLMLLRPQGIFGTRELSLDWWQRTLRRPRQPLKGR